jgi:hypothetical protein
MKKIIFPALIIWAVLSVVSCKSAPPAEPDARPAQRQEADSRFINAYEAVLPIIYEGAQNYTVKSGDSLIRIARSFYGRGNAFFFPLIMAASNEKQTVEIADPDLIMPGMQLVIPDLKLNLAHPEIKARIKTLLESVSKIYENKKDVNWSFEVYNGLAAAAGSL